MYANTGRLGETRYIRKITLCDCGLKGDIHEAYRRTI